MGEGEFFKATSLQEACDLLARFGNKAHVLAGGTDLMVQVNRNRLSPQAIVYIGECGLNYIKAEGGKLIIGAATPFSDIAHSKLVKQGAPVLAEVAGLIGSVAIRNTGTIGGNLAHGSPAADSAVALLALGAQLKLVSAKGERTVDAARFFTGPGETVLKADELLKEVIVPIKAGQKASYRRIGKRKADFIAIASAAVALEMENGECKSARVALGSVAPTPLLSAKAPQMLIGHKLDAGLIEQVAKAIADETTPIDDVRGTAWYRRRASAALVKQILGQMAG